MLEPRLSGEYEILVVDDDSPDGTWAIAMRLAERLPMVRVMRRRGEKGLSTAVIRGWQAARGEVLAVIDADLQHPPEVLARLWESMEAGADLAAASRHVQGGGVSDWSALRRALSRGAQLLGLAVLPSVVGRLTDPMSGYFMVRRSAIADAEMSPLGYKILIEVVGRGRIRSIAETGYVFRERTAGESKVTARLYVDYLRHLVRLRIATLPPRFPRFAVVGFSGVVVDMGLLFLLSDPHALGWGLTRSKVLAAEAAIVNNFMWNDAWTFGDLAKRLGGGSDARAPSPAPAGVPCRRAQRPVARAAGRRPAPEPLLRERGRHRHRHGLELLDEQDIQLGPARSDGFVRVSRGRATARGRDVATARPRTGPSGRRAP